MSLPLKVAATAGVVGGGSLVGCYFGGVFSDTPWLSVKEETGTVYDAGKVGASNYSIYLLAVYGTDSNDSKNKDFNKTKWEELYKRYENGHGDSTDFGKGKVGSAYSSFADKSTVTSLNKVCDSVYKKTVGTEVDFGKGTDPKHKLAQDLLKYCSPLEKKPSTVQENADSYTNGLIGSDNDLKNLLASTKDSGNYYFWEAQDKWFKKEAKNNTEITNDKFFGKFFKGGNGESKILNSNLVSICREAYGLVGGDSDSEENKPNKNKVKKYCSFVQATD